MNKILIVDAPDSDCLLMFGLLTRAGYDPVIAYEKNYLNKSRNKLCFTPMSFFYSELCIISSTGYFKIAYAEQYNCSTKEIVSKTD